MKMNRFALVIVATAFAAACSSNPVAPESSASNPPEADSPTVTTVTVSGDAAISADAQLTASAQFSNSTALDVTALASWASSNPAFATISSTGTVTVVGTGDVELRATYQNVVGVFQVAVTVPEAPAAFFLTGLVRDSSTGQLLAGVDTRVLIDSGRHTTTDELGIYRFDGLETGRILVEFTKDGYQVREISLTMTGDRRVDVSLDRVDP